MTARKWASNQDANGRKVTNLGAPTNGSTDAARKVDIEAVQAFAISRANHTGTQLAATISDFDVQVRTNRIDQLTAPTNPVGFNAQRITGLADPSAAQDAATKAYVDAQLSGLTSGMTPKGSVRVVATSNITIATPGATIDGVTMVNGDVVLLAGQTTGSQNGPYVWTGASTPLTRATNWDVAGETTLGSFWIVREGTNADKFALLTNDAFTLGTTTATFKYVDVAAAQAAAYETDLGDGTATSFTVTHNLGTKAVSVDVYRNASPFDAIDVYISRPTVNTITIEPDEVWSSAQYHVVVGKVRG